MYMNKVFLTGRNSLPLVRSDLTAVVHVFIHHLLNPLVSVGV